MDADADTTLEFDEAQLDAVYAKISPYIVGLPLVKGDEVAIGLVATGFIIGRTSEHCMIAVHSYVTNGHPGSVRYANKKVAPIAACQIINNSVTILYAELGYGEPELDLLVYKDPLAFKDRIDDVREKIVTFFHYKSGIAMFKGHIISDEDVEATEFTLTCPYASAPLLKEADDMRETLYMTRGALVCDLEGVVLGVLNFTGRSYDVKYAMKARLFFKEATKGNPMKGKSNSKDKRRHMKDKHEEDDGQGKKCAKKGKKSNSNDQRKHMKDKHKENGGQYPVGSRIAHYLMAWHDDTSLIN